MAEQKDQRDTKKTWGAAYARATTLAFVLPTTTFVGYAIGYGLDKWLGTRYLSLVFLVLGVVAGFVQLIRETSKGE